MSVRLSDQVAAALEWSVVQRDSPEVAPVTSVRPERTCIGCRGRASTDDMVRMVARVDHDGSTRIVVDHRHSLAGRGAWLHPVSECAHLADRRRAFGRALRVAGFVDTSGVHEVVLASELDRNRDTATS